MFKSVNEIDKLVFDDCIINSFEFEKDRLVLELDALIIAATNSQNSNFTTSYADTAKMTFSNASIDKIILAGYKVYDANDNLLEEVDDKVISEEDYKEIFARLPGGFLYRILQVYKDDKKVTYDLEIEFETGEQRLDLRSDAFVISVSTTEVVVTWDRYLNRVQQ